MVLELMKNITVFMVFILIALTPIVINLNAQYIIKHSDNNYAVIVVGRYAGRYQDALPKNFQKYYTWYLNSAGRTYSMLKDTYGYSDENIFLLVTIREGYTIPDSFNVDWIDYISNKDNLKYVLSQFKPGGDIWLNNNDSLVFTFINHGNDEDKLT